MYTKERIPMICKNCGGKLPDEARFCGQCGVPVEVNKQTASRKRAGRIAVSLLVFVIFAGGCLTGGWLLFNAWRDLRTPYRASMFSELKESLERLEDGCGEEQAALAAEHAAKTEEIQKYNILLAEYREGRQAELPESIVRDETFDAKALFENDFFQAAWEQYITDLIDAFKADERIDSWLYPYYTYSLERGANIYIDEDLWVYDNYRNEDEKFSADLSDYNTFRWTCYDDSLYDHLYADGRIYITGADFLDYVLYLQDYAVNGAVFVKACGGNPDPAEMYVPGWTARDYEDFWDYADDYYYADAPVWFYYDLSAEDFALNWNQLIDEKAFYAAYTRLMDTIAPGLPRFEMAEYYGDDTFFGGMGYSMKGKEASLNRIAALYLENNPSCLETLGIDPDAIPSSYDSQIDETETALEQLEEELADVEQRQAELTAFLASGDALQASYDRLQAESRNHEALLRGNLVLFAGITGFLFLMALLCLCQLFSFLKNGSKRNP